MVALQTGLPCVREQRPLVVPLAVGVAFEGAFLLAALSALSTHYFQLAKRSRPVQKTAVSPAVRNGLCAEPIIASRPATC